MEKTLQVFTIQQASDHSNVSKHTLRFWEKELEGIIVPLRTRGGQRRYTLKHLLIIEEIKRLKKKGLSLVEIKETLRNHRHTHDAVPSRRVQIDFLADRISEIVKAAIYNILEGRLPD